MSAHDDPKDKSADIDIVTAHKQSAQDIHHSTGKILSEDSFDENEPSSEVSNEKNSPIDPEHLAENRPNVRSSSNRRQKIRLDHRAPESLVIRYVSDSDLKRLAKAPRELPTPSSFVSAAVSGLVGSIPGVFDGFYVVFSSDQMKRTIALALGEIIVFIGFLVATAIAWSQWWLRRKNYKTNETAEQILAEIRAEGDKPRVDDR